MTNFYNKVARKFGNYHTDAKYTKDFPKQDVVLETEKGRATFVKMDIFKGLLWYASKEEGFKWYKLTLEQVQEVIAMNKNGEKAPSLEELESETIVATKIDFENVVGQDSLTRFDKPKTKNKRRNKKKKPGQGQNQQGNSGPRKQGPRKPNNGQSQNKEGGQKRKQGNKNANPNQKNPNANPNAKPNANGPKQGAPKKRRPQNKNKQNPNAKPNPNQKQGGAKPAGANTNETGANNEGGAKRPKRNNNRRKKPNPNNKPNPNATKDA